MRIEIVSPDTLRASETCRIRVLLFNDSYEPVDISRNAFVGPNLHVLTPVEWVHPDSVEATFGGEEQPLTLQPFTFYGREREFSGLQPGEIEISAFYRPGDEQTELSATQKVQVLAG